MRRSLITSLAVLAFLAAALPASGQTMDKPTEPAPPFTGNVEGSLEVTKTGMYVDGKPVGAAPAGVEVTLVLTFRNAGSEALKDLKVRLSIPPEGARFVDDEAALGDLAPGASAEGEFSFVLVGDCFDFLGFGGEAVHAGGSFPLKIAVPAACPGPRLTLTNVIIEGGDGDGVPEPGEKLHVTFELANQGRDPARNVRASVEMSGDGLSASGTDLVWPDIEPGGSARSSEPLILSISKEAERQEPCTPGVIREDPGIVVDDKALPPDGTVSSDGSVSPGAGSDGGAPGTAPGSEPAGAAGSEPSSGSDGTAVAEPTTGTVEPQPPVEPTTGTGGGEPGSPGTIEPEPIEPGPIEPDPGITTEPVPLPPIEPLPEPVPEDQAVRIQAVLSIAADGYETAAEWANTIYCAVDTLPGTDAALAAERARDDSDGAGGTAMPVSVALGISAAAVLAHRRLVR